MAAIHITDIESAINWWRERSPSPDSITACPEVRALATVYALMVYYHESECDEATLPEKARDAWLAWYATTPDAPCIAICSTSQGDSVCKGCGRTFDEVQHWTEMSPAEKRATWRRITMDGTAWRFNRYAERAQAGSFIERAQAGLAVDRSKSAPSIDEGWSAASTDPAEPASSVDGDQPDSSAERFKATSFLGRQQTPVPDDVPPACFAPEPPEAGG